MSLPRHNQDAALLPDDFQPPQLVTDALSKILYRDGCSLVGAEAELAEPIMLCAPCKSFMLNAPSSPLNLDWDFAGKEESIPLEAWHTHHRTLFALVDCCYGHRESCQLCRVLWHGLCRQLSRRRLPLCHNGEEKDY